MGQSRFFITAALVTAIFAAVGARADQPGEPSAMQKLEQQYRMEVIGTFDSMGTLQPLTEGALTQSRESARRALAPGLPATEDTARPVPGGAAQPFFSPTGGQGVQITGSGAVAGATKTVTSSLTRLPAPALLDTSAVAVTSFAPGIRFSDIKQFALTHPAYFAGPFAAHLFLSDGGVIRHYKVLPGEKLTVVYGGEFSHLGASINPRATLDTGLEYRPGGDLKLLAKGNVTKAGFGQDTRTTLTLGGAEGATKSVDLRVFRDLGDTGDKNNHLTGAALTLRKDATTLVAEIDRVERQAPNGVFSDGQLELRGATAASFGNGVVLNTSAGVRKNAVDLGFGPPRPGTLYAGTAAVLISAPVGGNRRAGGGVSATVTDTCLHQAAAFAQLVSLSEDASIMVTASVDSLNETTKIARAGVELSGTLESRMLLTQSRARSQALRIRKLEAQRDALARKRVEQLQAKADTSKAIEAERARLQLEQLQRQIDDGYKALAPLNGELERYGHSPVMPANAG